MLDLLTALIHKSLVVAEERAGQVRYGMLETVRHYALQQLVESCEQEAVRQLHAGYFTTLGERAAAGAPAPPPGTWSDHFEQEHDNVRAALRWLLDSRHGEEALQLPVSLRSFWEARSHYGEGQRWLEEALAQSPRAGAALRARGFSGAGWLAMLGGDYARGTALGEEALRLFRSTGERGAIAGSLMGVALPAMQGGDYPKARRCLEETLLLCRELDWPGGLAGALHLLGEVALNEGVFDEAVARAEESVALTRGQENRRFLINSLDNLARALLCRGDLQRAIPPLAEGLRLSCAWHDRRAMAYYLEGFAGAAAQQGRAEQAARLMGAAHALRQEIASPLSVPEHAICERLLAPARTQLDQATWTRAWQQGYAMPPEEAIADALHQDAHAALLPV